MHIHEKSERMQPVRARNDVTSAAATKDVTYRKWHSDGLTASSTEAVTTSGGGVAPTRITLTPASRNGSFDASGVTTSNRDGQQASSSAGTKSTGGTKQGGGILARGQKLLKHLAHRTENSRPAK